MVLKAKFFLIMLIISIILILPASSKLENITIYKYTFSYLPNYELKYSDLLTFFTIIISILVLSYSWWKDRQIKRKEYADKIRDAASSTIAKLERWPKLNYRFFYELRPIYFDTALILKDRNKQRKLKVSKRQELKRIEARDFLFKNIYLERSKCNQKIVDEQIELAYKDLYGYDIEVEVIFNQAIKEIVKIDTYIDAVSLILLQEDVLEFKFDQYPELVNRLINTSSMLAFLYKGLVDEVLFSFREEMVSIIESTDDKIFDKEIRINAPEKISRSDSYRFAMKGLHCLYCGNYFDAKEFFIEATKKNGLVPGFWAGKGLSFQARELDQIAKEAFDHVLGLIYTISYYNDDIFKLSINYKDINLKP